MYYLSGQKQYPGADKQILDISEPPDLSKRVNFHHQPALIVSGYDRVVELLNDPWYQQFEVVNIYLGSTHFYKDIVKQHLKENIDNLSTDQISKVFDTVAEDTKKMLAEIQNGGHNLYVFEFEHADLYTAIYNNRHPTTILENKALPSLNDRWQDWENVWYKDTNSNFDDAIWDRREKFALIVKKEPFYDILSKLDRSKPHLYYTSDDVWNGMHTIINEMCDFAGINPDPEKLTKWLSAYKEWRLKHDPWTSRHIDRIVDAIINNHYLSLKRFDLDFYKEVLIQHMLITKHNMNLKTWQLEKFPNNTQDLHKLLEPNIHQL
jgi:hypothetical protein